MKNILFISRDFNHKGDLTKSYRQEHTDTINNNFINTGYGFFYMSLKSLGNLQISFGVNETLEILNKQKFDLLVYDLKFIVHSKITRDFYKFIKKLNCPCILLLGLDGDFTKRINMENIDKFFNFKNIYIPNLRKNYYEFKYIKNLIHKIKMTHYGLGNQCYVYNFNKREFGNNFFNNEKKRYDLFFAASTQKNKKLRNEFLNSYQNDLRSKDFNFKIEIFNSSDPNSFIGPKEYFRRMKQSNVSLDLSGTHDNITMRFNEIIFNNEVPLVDRGFKNFFISDEYKEVIADICFEDFDQFFYLLNKYKDENFRNNTISKIKKIWSSYYNPSLHGEQIAINLNW